MSLRCPPFSVAVALSEKTDLFELTHGHLEGDRPQREIVEEIIRFVEKHATTPARK